MKVRDAIRELKDAGFENLRQGASSHQQWSSGDQHVTLVVNHLNDDLSPVVLKNFKRAIKAVKERERNAPRQAIG